MNRWYVFSLGWFLGMISLLIWMIPLLNNSNSLLILIPMISMSFGCAYGLQKADPKEFGIA